MTAHDAKENQKDLLEKADELYQKYGKPLEAEHFGELVAISDDGQTVLGKTMLDAIQRASAAFGPGGHVFKVGPMAVGQIALLDTGFEGEVIIPGTAVPQGVIPEKETVFGSRMARGWLSCCQPGVHRSNSDRRFSII